MDFSSIPRALESLQRRQPPLSSHVLEQVNILQQQTTDTATVLSALQTLMTLEECLPGSDKVRWEPLAVGLYVATQVLLQQQELKQAPSATEAQVYMEGPRVPSTVETPTTTATNGSTIHLDDAASQLALGRLLHETSLLHLEHSEPRVRTLVAKAVGAYAALPELAQERSQLYTKLVDSIHSHISLGRDENGNYSRSSTGALDDTTGWRALETNWLALASLVTATNKYLQEFPLTPQLLDDVQFSCIVHVNRHVRAAGMAVLEQWIQQAKTDDRTALTDPTSPLCATTIQVLQDGLADNWSQVRMAASVLCRVFLMALKDVDAPMDAAIAKLLPRMCLNRFYLAQGVKLYSHETWRMLFADSGLPLVAQHVHAVSRYYVKMCDADNHVVREAACQAVAELAVRMNDVPEYKATLEPLVDVLLQALLMCFHDESWPVRDEACLATAILCKAFPDECRPELKTLWERWTEQLTDQIWSVREDAAVALGDALRAYGPEMLQQIMDLVNKLLPSAKEQPAMTPAEYKARQNDMQAHTNSQLYSCGSLAPKLRKGGAGRIGCSSCDVNREKSPWEATDGCIYLIRELVIICSPPDSATPLNDDQLVALLRELADVCRVRHFPQADDLRATLWRNLPVMAQALGKDRFKRRYLDIFMDLLFSNLESRSASQLSIHAAGQCAEELANLVGKSIFRGRLEDYQRDVFDQVMRERQMMPKGPADEGAFSPFGPPGLLDNVGKGGGVHPGMIGPGAVRPHV